MSEYRSDTSHVMLYSPHCVGYSQPDSHSSKSSMPLICKTSLPPSVISTKFPSLSNSKSISVPSSIVHVAYFVIVYSLHLSMCLSTIHSISLPLYILYVCVALTQRYMKKKQNLNPRQSFLDLGFLGLCE